MKPEDYIAWASLILTAALLCLVALGCSTTRGKYEYHDKYAHVFEQGIALAKDRCGLNDDAIRYYTGIVLEPDDVVNGQPVIRNPRTPNDTRLRPAWFVSDRPGFVTIYIARNDDIGAMINSVWHESVHAFSGESGHPKHFKDCAPDWRDL